MNEEMFEDCSCCPLWPDECGMCRKYNTETKLWADEDREVEALRNAHDK